MRTDAWLLDILLVKILFTFHKFLLVEKGFPRNIPRKHFGKSTKHCGKSEQNWKTTVSFIFSFLLIQVIFPAMIRRLLFGLSCITFACALQISSRSNMKFRAFMLHSSNNVAPEQKNQLQSIQAGLISLAFLTASISLPDLLAIPPVYADFRAAQKRTYFRFVPKV